MKKIILILIVFIFAGCQTQAIYTKPVLPVLSQPSQGLIHRVQAGQTLWKISRIYDVDIDDILRLNHLSEDATIEVGQAISIPSRLKPQSVSLKSGQDDFIWPLKGRVIAGFGSNNRNLINKGINIQAQNQPDILAARSGRIVFYALNFGNFGKMIIIDHGDGLRSVYSRMQESFVRSGETVERGALIGRVGASARDKNNYLHFEIRKGAIAQNPLFYLP